MKTAVFELRATGFCAGYCPTSETGFQRQGYSNLSVNTSPALPISTSMPWAGSTAVSRRETQENSRH